MFVWLNAFTMPVNTPIFSLLKKIFIGLLTGIVSASNHKKCLLLSNQKCITQPTLINLHPNEYSQQLQYYPSAVTLDRCVGSCNTLEWFILQGMCSK